MREAYRRLTKAVHPDTGGSKGPFVVLTDAYEAITVLREPDRSGGDDGRRRNDDRGRGPRRSGVSGARGEYLRLPTSE